MSKSKAAPRNPEAILRRLEWTVMRRLDGLLHGDYRTLFRGFGLDLADIREYQYGDDVRHIDWNVTARLQTPYVREYHEDREITAWFLLDLSRSIDFGSQDVQKRALSADFVALLARLLTRLAADLSAWDGIRRLGRQHKSAAVEKFLLPFSNRLQQRARRRQTDGAREGRALDADSGQVG